VKILVDVNLSPAWVPFLTQAGFESVYWSTVGDVRAPDGGVMAWARENGYVVFTHDMDFGALLAATRARGPSVLQARVKDTMPDVLGPDVLRVLHLRREALAGPRQLHARPAFDLGIAILERDAGSAPRVVPLATQADEGNGTSVVLSPRGARAALFGGTRESDFARLTPTPKMAVDSQMSVQSGVERTESAMLMHTDMTQHPRT
jgi:predicted nuclease of predicted toxin-antitoxin system